MNDLSVANTQPMHPMSNWVISKIEAAWKRTGVNGAGNPAYDFGTLYAMGLATREQAEQAFRRRLEQRGLADHYEELAETFERGCESATSLDQVQRLYNADKSPDAPIPAVSPSEWRDKPLIEREWTVGGLIPRRSVTSLSGNGATGKTLLAIQLAAAMQFHAPWLGLNVAPGRALIYTAEDDEHELQRRFSVVTEHAGRDLSELAGICVIPMAGSDAVLARPNETGQIVATATWKKIEAQIVEHRPALIVIDPAADVFAGDENNRAQVRQFVQMLSGWALRYDCAVLLLSHPSLTGLTSGSGTSGSTAWNNSVRSRLYLEAVKGEPDKRVLRVMKSNYGKTGTEIGMRWDNGVYVADGGNDAASVAADDAKTDELFLSVFSKLTSQGQTLGPNKSPSYAPKRIAIQPEAKGIKSTKLADAMQRLLDAGKLRIDEDGPPSRRRQFLVATAN